MERVISNLVSQFECGKISRRQLIRDLAVAVGAATVAATDVSASTLDAAQQNASAPAASAANPAASAPFKAVTVNHISYQSADYTKIRDFYSGLLGMPVSHDDGRQCFLSFGDSFLIPRNANSSIGGSTPRIDHIAYTIDTWNADAVKAELTRRGLNPRPDTPNSFHVRDAEGFDLQISGRDMKP
jgi:catechol 2,3-dioxygenase-like lactoylglutathione lyase family enzyme